MFVVIVGLVAVVVFMALKTNQVAPPPESGAVGPPVDATASNVQAVPIDTAIPPVGAATPVSPATLDGAGAAGTQYKQRLFANYGLAGVSGNYYIPGRMVLKVGGATSPTPDRDEAAGRLVTQTGVEVVGSTTASLKGSKL